MLSEVQSARLNHPSRLFLKADQGLLVASILVQSVLGFLFGHLYDIRIFMATGYLVATGQDPYIAQNLTAVFNNPAFQGMTSVGYPPPWPLILGGIYLVSYNFFHNPLIYNLAIKMPIILANLLLAYAVRDILKDQGINQGLAHKAWLFMLFNPFLIYFNTAWGQFDSLVALLTLVALVELYKERLMTSSFILALAISFKPTPVPVVLAVMAYLWRKPWKRSVSYLLVLVVSLLLLCVAPFYLLHWDATPILRGWNNQFTVSGGMALTTIYELLTNTYVLPGNWWLLGVLWLPAILITAWFVPRGNQGFVRLLKNSLVLVLVFFLTRTWLSEQNLTLILPMVLILVVLGELPSLTLTATWVLPLIFTIFNTSPPQLLFPILPELMTKLLQWMDIYRLPRLIAKMVIAIPWQMAGWWMVSRGFSSRMPKPA